MFKGLMIINVPGLTCLICLVSNKDTNKDTRVKKMSMNMEQIRRIVLNPNYTKLKVIQFWV